MMNPAVEPREDFIEQYLNTPVTVCPVCGWLREFKCGVIIKHTIVADGWWLRKFPNPDAMYWCEGGEQPAQFDIMTRSVVRTTGFVDSGQTHSWSEKRGVHIKGPGGDDDEHRD